MHSEHDTEGNDFRWQLSAVVVGIALLLGGCWKAPSPTPAAKSKASAEQTRTLTASPEMLAEEVAQTMSLLGAQVIRNEEGAVHSVVLTDLPVSDAALAPLKELGELEVLSLSGTRITNSGMAHLTGIERLTYLFMNDTDVTDQGLLTLANSVALRYISLDNTSVTPKAVEEFRKLSPGTVVQHSPRRANYDGTLPSGNKANWRAAVDFSRSLPLENLSTSAITARSAVGSFGAGSDRADSTSTVPGVRLRYRSDNAPTTPAGSK